MKNYKIVLLCRNGLSSNVVFNSINANFGVHTAIVEEPISKKVLIAKRIKRLGLVKVIGQLLFQILISPLLAFFSKRRCDEIILLNKLNTNPIPKDKIKKVSSINDSQTIRLLQNINPDLIIVNGTRIISKRVLESVHCKFINTHAGITPKYRGVHGTYWALVNNDIQNSGVTVHFVDKGIDTGEVIYQATVSHTGKDNFSTYPLLQLAEGIKILNQAILDYCDNNIQIIYPQLDSHLWYHPTIFEYFYFRLKRSVK